MSPKMGSETRLYRKSTFILRRSSTRRASSRSMDNRRRAAGTNPPAAGTGSHPHDEVLSGGSRAGSKAELITSNRGSASPSLESIDSSQSGAGEDEDGRVTPTGMPPGPNKFRHRLHRSRKVLQLRKSRRGGSIQVLKKFLILTFYR